MRFLLLPLLAMLAGCAAPAADLAPASADAITTEVPLEAAEGQFVVATNLPAQDAPCEGVGTVLAPAPAPGAWVEWTLQPGAELAKLEISEEAPPFNEIGYRVCAFVGEALVAETSGLAALRLDVPVAGASALRVFVGPEAVTPSGSASVNEGVEVRWTLAGILDVSGPAASA